MTEEEAKQRWCPFARLGNEPGCNRWPTPAERNEEEDSRALCIASDCMAWRWDREANAERGRPYIQAIKDYREKHPAVSLVEAKHAVDETWVRPSPTNGYCGLAGAPQ